MEPLIDGIWRGALPMREEPHVTPSDPVPVLISNTAIADAITIKRLKTRMAANKDGAVTGVRRRLGLTWLPARSEHEPAACWVFFFLLRLCSDRED